MKRFSTANWKGTGKEGTGTVSTQSTVLNNSQYSYSSRFENGIGTNPEELVAAAHAGCFSMKLSFVLNAAGFTADNIDTRCEITLDSGAITESKLTVKATVTGISKDQFDAAVADAKANCPISKLYNTNIVAEATLAYESIQTKKPVISTGFFYLKLADNFFYYCFIYFYRVFFLKCSNPLLLQQVLVVVNYKPTGIGKVSLLPSRK